MDNNTIRDKVAAEVRATQGRANISAAELSRETGISKAALHRKLRGETSFSIEEIIAVARACDVPVGSLIAPADISASEAA